MDDGSIIAYNLIGCDSCKGTNKECDYYFAHKEIEPVEVFKYIKPEPKYTTSLTTYGLEFASSVKKGTIFGLMPHPEAYNHFTNHPDWTREKSQRKRRANAEDIDQNNLTLGIKIFKNGVDSLS